MKNEKIKAILIGVGTAVGVFLAICLGRSLIKGTTFAEQAGRAFNWFLAGLGCAGTAVSYLRKKQASDLRISTARAQAWAVSVSSFTITGCPPGSISR